MLVKMKGPKLFFFIVISLMGECYSQDIHFSQFYETPSLLNPAMIGVTNKLRASLQYKNQWSSVTVPYKTFAASIEMRFNQNNSEKNTSPGLIRNLSGGISVISDKAGDGDMGLLLATFSLASRVSLDDNNAISAGLQAGIVQRSINYDKLIFPNQYTGSGYDPNYNSGESFNATKFSYGDFAAGLLWTYGRGEMYMSANDEFKANAGISLYHVSQPKEKFLSNVIETLKMRFLIHGGMLIGIPNSNLDIAPSFIVNRQGKSDEIVLGTLFKYQLREDSKYTGYIKSAIISLGGYYRTGDAIIPTVLFEIGQYALGLSYDVNVSALKAASSYRGGIEISLRFVGVNPFLFQNKSRF